MERFSDLITLLCIVDLISRIVYQLLEKLTQKKNKERSIDI